MDENDYIEESKKLPDWKVKQAERDARIAEDNYRKTVRNFVIAWFLVMVLGILWLSPRAAGADAAYQAYTVEVAR